MIYAYCTRSYNDIFFRNACLLLNKCVIARPDPLLLMMEKTKKGLPQMDSIKTIAVIVLPEIDATEKTGKTISGFLLNSKLLFT